MALKATIFKADVQISDMDRNYYENHALTIARHPSETDERMMMRVLAFMWHANERLAFGKGLSAEDDADLWQKDFTDAIELWIDVGLPDDKRILKACGRSERVVVYAYSQTVPIWWGQTGSRIERAKKLTVYSIDPATSTALAAMAERTMQLQCTIQDGQAWITSGDKTVQVDRVLLQGEST
jgi:uncharacterized protein YaeQ